MTCGRRRAFPDGMQAAVSIGTAVVPLWKGGSDSRVGAWLSGVGRSAPGVLQGPGNIFECDLQFGISGTDLRGHSYICRGKGCNRGTITGGSSGEVRYGIYGVLLVGEVG